VRREEILVALHKLEVAFRPIPVDRMAATVDMLLRKQVTDWQLNAAILSAIEQCDTFPSISKLLKLIPTTQRNPDAPQEDLGLADLFDREEQALRMWKRRFVEKGSYGEADRVQRRIDDINRRRASRGFTSKLPGEVQNFDGTPLNGIPERDWVVADLVNYRTGQVGYPNELSTRASNAKLDRIIERFGPEAAFRVSHNTQEMIGGGFQ
jgi:hypothetical protein